MVLTTWYIRGNGDKADHIDEVYEKSPSFFSLEIHHGGVFTKYPDRCYLDGKVSYVDCIDGDQFSVLELNAMLQELGYKDPIPMWYHFKAPDSDLDYGLHALGSDQDVRFLLKYVGKFKLIEVYIEQWKTSLKTYEKVSMASTVVIEEMEDPVVDKEPKKRPCKKALFSDDAYVPKAVETVETDLGQGSAPTGTNVDALNDEFFIDEFFNVSIPTGTDLGQGSGPNVNVNEGEQVGQSSGTNIDIGEEDDSGEDSDFIVDDEHRIEDVEVDMTDFRETIDGDIEWLPDREENLNRGIIGETEVEKVNFDNIDSQSDSEDDVRTQALKRLRRDHNTNPHNIGHFYTGQAFGTKKEIKEMVTQLSIETRRNLKIVKNDKDRFRVTCEGTIPVFSQEVNVGPSQNVGPSENVGPSPQKKGYVPCGIVPRQSPQGIRFVKRRPNKEVVKKHKKETTCPFTLHISKSGKDETWVVKTYIDTHKCLQARVLKRCTSEFLATQIQEQLHPNSKVRAADLRDQIQEKFEIGFSKYKIYRAKEKARERLMGDYKHQYAILRDYILELQATNPDTTVKLDFEPEPNPNIETRVFRRIYVCLGSLKQGFKAGGRDLLGLDGTFLKGMTTGQCLTAVGVDPNNGTFPVAYAIVESENKASWVWFLEHLGADLDLDHMSNFTFISDRQKGIIPAIAQLFPCAEHRFCLKHIYDNMKLQWRGQVYKDFLWKAATATTVPEFNKVMEDLKKVNTAAYDWLKAIPPRHWSRSHFTGRSHCDVLLNNMCESVNAKLVDGRERPVIMCLEYIREYLMKRHAKVQKMIDTCDGPLTPNATVTFDLIKKEAGKYKVIWNGGTKFQVAGPWMDQCVVDMIDRTCSCRKWELTGMPCKHAVAAMFNMAENNMVVGIPESYVHPSYWVATWRTMYTFTIGPTKGMSHWPKFESPITLLPPKQKVSIGRPKKKRRRTQVEIQLIKEGKLTRAAALTKCGHCKEDGHNKRTCTKAPRQQGSREGGSTSRAGGSSNVGRKNAPRKKAATKKATN